MGIKKDGFACRNEHCPATLKSTCNRFGAVGTVRHFVPVRNDPKFQGLSCDGFDKRVGR